MHSYFTKVHQLFPIVHREKFLSLFHRTSDAGILPDYLAWAVFLAASCFSTDPQLQEGRYGRIEIERRLKQSCQRELEQGKSSDLHIIQALILGQLFPAKRERKVALLSWTVNGRAIKLALKRRLNVNPQRLGHDLETYTARICTWWCVYIADIWDAARRGRPSSIHEGEYDVPVPTLGSNAPAEEIYFVRLVALTKILSRVLFFGFNNPQSSESFAHLDAGAEETVRKLRIELADWYAGNTLRRQTSLAQSLNVAYLTVVILLHRHLLPSPLATAFSNPIVLLVTQCASSIVRTAQFSGLSDAGSIPWRLFVPAVGYLTAGITLAQNATWSTHYSGADPLRLNAQKDIRKLLAVFDQATAAGHHTSGMAEMLRNVCSRSGVDLTATVDGVPEIKGQGLPLPHEDPGFFANRMRSIHEKSVSLPEQRAPAPTLEPLASGTMPAPRAASLTEAAFRKRKHSQVSHSQKGTPQPLPSLANLTGLDTGRRSPAMRSVHSISTHSSNSSASHALYPPALPHPPSTAYHPSYGTHRDKQPPRAWEPSRPVSPPPPQPFYDRRYSDTAPRDPSAPITQHQQQSLYYQERREELYPRSVSPSHPYSHEHLNPPYGRPSYSAQTGSPLPRVPPPPPIDPRYRHPTPPLSSTASNSPLWPAGYPYVNPQKRYEVPSPRTYYRTSPSVPQSRWPEYYPYPSQRS